MYEAALPCLNIPAKTPKGRTRRIEQITWSTVAREVLQKKRRRPEEDEEDEEEEEELPTIIL